MKKIAILSIISIAAFLVISCDDVKRTPGSVYMPDMATSRAYETYADHSNLASKGISYNNMPVAGTVARGEEMPYHLLNDTSGYAMSNTIVNPLSSWSPADSIETERQYLINCAICHGTKMDGNGPLYKDGQGPYGAKPATLVGDATIEAKGEGDYYHVQTYGKGQMGSYSAQLNRKQRWMLARYIKLRQKSAAASATPSKDSTATAAK